MLKSLPPGGRCRVYEAEGARVQIRLLKKFCLRTILHLQTDKSNPKFLNHALSLSLLLRKIQLPPRGNVVNLRKYNKREFDEKTNSCLKGSLPPSCLKAIHLPRQREAFGFFHEKKQIYSKLKIFAMVLYLMETRTHCLPLHIMRSIM